MEEISIVIKGDALKSLQRMKETFGMGYGELIRSSLQLMDHLKTKTQENCSILIYDKKTKETVEYQFKQ